MFLYIIIILILIIILLFSLFSNKKNNELREENERLKKELKDNNNILNLMVGIYINIINKFLELIIIIYQKIFNSLKKLWDEFITNNELIQWDQFEDQLKKVKEGLKKSKQELKEFFDKYFNEINNSLTCIFSNLSQKQKEKIVEEMTIFAEKINEEYKNNTINLIIFKIQNNFLNILGNVNDVECNNISLNSELIIDSLIEESKKKIIL